MRIELMSPFNNYEIEGEFIPREGNEFSFIFNSKNIYSKESLSLTTYLGSVEGDTEKCIVWIVREVKTDSDRKGDLILPKTRVELVLKKKLPEGALGYKWQRAASKPSIVINPEDDCDVVDESISAKGFDSECEGN